MNVFLCCLQSPVARTAALGSFWRANFLGGLEDMGHAVIEPADVDLAEPLRHVGDPGWLRRQRAVNSERLLAQVRRAHREHGVDLFLSYFWAFHVDPGMLREIERLGVPTVNFFCDNLRDFHDVVGLVDSVTLNWVPERAACELYRRRGVPYVHLPMAADPKHYRPSPGTEIDQVSFVGSPDYLRAELLWPVLRAGLPLQVYGDAWLDAPPRPDARPLPAPSLFLKARQHWRRMRWFGLRGELRHLAARGRGAAERALLRTAANPGMPHEDMLRVTSRSTVVLGINRCPSPGHSSRRPLRYSRLRDFEAPMAGACYLTESCADLEELYEIGAEITVYHEVEDLIAQAERLRREPGTRQALRAAGRRAALASHTWRHRFEVLFDRLGLGAKAKGERRVEGGR